VGFSSHGATRGIQRDRSCGWTHRKECWSAPTSLEQSGVHDPHRMYVWSIYI
jgi:hypothetical protein